MATGSMMDTLNRTSHPAGVINTFCYVGSTLSSVLLGYIAEIKGWESVFEIMIVFSAVVMFVNIVIGYILKNKTV